jgi:hypothetical protein
MNRFEREQNLSIYWANRASDLRGAAGAVWFAMENEGSSDQVRTMLGMEQHYRFSAACPLVFFMLCGLSLELLYKALIVEDEKKPPAIHDLRKLSTRAHLKLTADDLRLIDLLTDHILWAGKYPVPKGGEPEWDRHVEQMNAALTSPVPNFSIPVVRRNERLSWGDYTRIWKLSSVRYWELYNQRNS